MKRLKISLMMKKAGEEEGLLLFKKYQSRLEVITERELVKLRASSFIVPNKWELAWKVENFSEHF